jgi:hypothetical protein
MPSGDTAQRRKLSAPGPGVWNVSQEADVNAKGRALRDKTLHHRREGSMTVQWTVHIPQAMQRHGASVKPCADTTRDRMLAYRVQQATVQSDMPPRRTEDVDEAA